MTDSDTRLPPGTHLRPTAVLMREHRVIERVSISTLLAVAARVEEERGQRREELAALVSVEPCQARSGELVLDLFDLLQGLHDLRVFGFESSLSIRVSS